MTERIQLATRTPQLLIINVSGNDATWMDVDRAPELADDERAVPDLVERWVGALNIGLLGSPRMHPSRCKARVATKERTDELTLRWTVEVESLDPASYLVLLNMLRARTFDDISLLTRPLFGAVDLAIDAQQLEYPRFSNELPFAVEREEVTKSAQGRAVFLGFSRVQSSELEDEAIEALDLWAELLVWGGYPSKETHPSRSGALSTGAVLYDESTIAQSFPDAFFCDEAAFEAIVSYALTLCQRGISVDRVSIQ